jgi:hypothetical protein
MIHRLVVAAAGLLVVATNTALADPPPTCNQSFYWYAGPSDNLVLSTTPGSIQPVPMPDGNGGIIYTPQFVATGPTVNTAMTANFIPYFGMT